MKKVLSILLYAVIVCFGLLPFEASGQRSTGVKNRAGTFQSYNVVGLLREVISESVDFTQSQTTFMIQEDSGRMIPVSGNFDFQSLSNTRVILRGVLNYQTGVVRVNSVDPIIRTTIHPTVQPQMLPLGQYDFDLSTKEGEQEFGAAVVNGEIILPPPTVGERMTIIVPVEFTNNHNTVLSQEELTSRIYTGSPSVSEFFSQASFGRFVIHGQVMPTVQMPNSDEDCTTNMFGNWTQWIISQLPPELVAQNNNYVFLPPAIPGCNWGAVSSVGIKGNNTTHQYAWIQQTPITLDPNRFISAVSHELGHQFGLQHAEGISLSGVVCGTCDRADFMSSRLRYPNAYTRLTLGWFNGKVTTLNGQGEYSVNLLSPAVLANKRPSRVVLIPTYNQDGTPTGNMKFLEIRKDMNFYEAFSQLADYRLGLSIRTGPMDLSLSSSRSYLIHMHDAVPINYDHAPLYVGEHFLDQTDGTNIEYLVFSLAGGGRAKIIQTRGP